MKAYASFSRFLWSIIPNAFEMLIDSHGNDENIPAYLPVYHLKHCVTQIPSQIKILYKHPSLDSPDWDVSA